MFHYLLYCPEDDSYCLHNQSDVLCDSKVAKAGDSVIFWHGNKKWNEQIVQKSRNEEYLEGELSELNKGKRRTKPAKPVQSNLIVEGKRGSRRLRSSSPDVDVKPKKKKPSTSDKQPKQTKSPANSDGTLETTLETTDEDLSKSELDHSKTEKPLNEGATDDLFAIKKSDPFKKQDSFRSRQFKHSSASTSANEGFDAPANSSKTKSETSRDDEYDGLSNDELKKIISRMKAQTELQSMNQNPNIEYNKKDDKTETIRHDNKQGVEKVDKKKQPREETSDVDDEDISISDKPHSSNQLFGKDFPGAKMIHLKDGIYCKEYDYEYATSGGSTKASHVARRLMVGVFKNEAVLRCTLTGAPPKAHGKERQSKVVEALDSTAKNAILEFATEFARKKKWEFQPEEKVRGQMSQKLGEMKRDMEKKRE